MLSRKVEKEMETARDVANGTMQMNIVFDTEEEVARAEAWMKGKRKVKNLTPITKDHQMVLHAKRMKEIAKKMGVGKKNSS